MTQMFAVRTHNGTRTSLLVRTSVEPCQPCHCFHYEPLQCKMEFSRRESLGIWCSRSSKRVRKWRRFSCAPADNTCFVGKEGVNQYSVQLMMCNQSYKASYRLTESGIGDASQWLVITTGISILWILAPCHSAIASEHPEMILAALQPIDVLWFCLQHPVVTLGAAALTWYIVPRATRAILRFLVLPAFLGVVALAVVQNPSQGLAALSTIVSFVNAHPIGVSIAILAALGIILSPYLLLGGLILILVVGVPGLPSPMRFFIPTPLLQTEQQLQKVRGQVMGPLQSTADSIREGPAGAFFQAAAPRFSQAREQVQSFGEAGGQRVQAISGRYQNFLESARTKFGQPFQQVKERAGHVMSIAGEGAGAVSGALSSAGRTVAGGIVQTRQTLQLASERIEEATACRKQATAELRIKCVEQQNAALQAARALPNR
eukprot:jgi/Botrbrau1/19294/Bobra.0073s0037.1